MTWLRLLITLPALAVWLMLLIRRQSIHPMPLEDAVHRGAAIAWRWDRCKYAAIRTGPK